MYSSGKCCKKCEIKHELGDARAQGGGLRKFLPGCVGWGFSNPPIVVHAKNNEDRPIMVLG